MKMSADEVKRLLGLKPHPREGGFFVRTYESHARVGDRHAATAIYYLLAADTFSEMHRLKSDELFHFYAGDTVEQLQLHNDGRAERVLLGHNLATGERPQVIVPSGVWQGARLVAGGEWALLGCTVTPGFDDADYEPGVASVLIAEWPEWSLFIRELTRS